jgi:transcriptional regulator with XRE-family HTH domain
MVQTLSQVTLLEALRVDRGLTAEAVSREAGISHKTLKAYETAIRPRPHGPVLDKLARFYGVRTSVLLDDIRRAHRARMEAEEAAITEEIEGVAGLLDAA